MERPQVKPQNPHFSSGPCAKRPQWSVEALADAVTGRSHRSGPGKAKLKQVIDQHKAILGIPDDYRVGIVPASDTGAVEMALWSLLGARGVDMVAWESFGADWVKDAQMLGLNTCNAHSADYGDIVDLNRINQDHDVVFTWNGTTSGVRVPHGDWIKDDRQGLMICDATSAVFAYDLPWQKLDVVTWSWQKVLGGEGAHGMIVLSPRAVERLEQFTPPRALPKIFRMTKKGKIDEALFQGATINTPSMIAVEDCLDALTWVESIGGIDGCIKRTQANFQAVTDWVEQTPWVHFLANDPATRSTTSICLTIDGADEAFIKAMCAFLDQENVAKDIAGYRAAPAGLRIWGGATVETTDIQALLPWLAYAYHDTLNAIEK